MDDIVLRVAGVVSGYVPDLPILKGVDMAVRRASVTVIIGPNGAGKSTLVKTIAGLVPLSAGHIAHDGVEIGGIRPDRLAAQGIAYVPQMDNIFRTLTIRQNLDLALRHAGADAAARLEELYTRFPPLAEKRNDRAGALSGGQRQFLAVAMALATRPSLILMDEPSAGLSPKAAQEVLECARGLTAQGVTILLVEQNVAGALAIADRAYLMASGRIIREGSAAEMRSAGAMADSYLGGH